MLRSESSSIERQNSEDMHRQSSRSATNYDALDCHVNTSDLVHEEEPHNHEPKPQRRTDSSRRDQPPKRSRETSNRRSPPLMTDKRYPNAPLVASSRSQHRHYPSQRNTRGSSPSPSPPPSRHHRSSRPVAAVAIKRPHSDSRSSSERRHAIHRSRPLPTDTPAQISASASEDQPLSRKPERISPGRDTGDLSFISEDESSKPTDVRFNRSATTNETSSSAANDKLHSTPSVTTARANGSESVLEMSQITPDYEISLFPNSYLSTSQANVSTTVPMSNANDLLLAIDLISKYKTMQSLPCADPQIVACEKEILKIIQKKIELQKLEVDHCERTIKLREQELQERERRVQLPVIESAPTPTITQSPLTAVEPVVTEANVLQEQPMDTAPVVETKHVPQEEESIAKPSATSVDPVDDNAGSKNGYEQASTTRKNGNKSRFSKIHVDPSIFPVRQAPAIDLYADDIDDPQSSPPTNNAGKKVAIPKILAPGEPSVSLADADLKVTSSNSCRTVEFQSGNPEKTASSKGLSHDLRYTLSKNRSKQAETDDADAGAVDGSDIKGGQLVSSDEDQTMTISKPITSKSQSNKDEKQQQSYDYHPQRSVTSSSSNEPLIDSSQDKRDQRRRPPSHPQPRYPSSRQQYQYYPGHSSSSTANSSVDRSYSHSSVSSQPKYNSSNQKRYENDDLRSQLFENKHSKPPRTAHRNNY